LQYGNIKAYLIHNKFNNIKEEADFINKYPKGKLGVHDEFMFNELLEQTNKNTEPFFSILFTLSSHSPYDQPSENIIKWGDSEDAFLNSAYYTDKCIGNFFAKAKKEKWYRNTLFILVADHSHNTYRHWAINQKEYRHIPMLFYGDVLKDEYKGEKYTKICSQTDLTTTLLKQLNLDASAFFWSKNLFNPTIKEFAYFELNEGFGWITPEGYLSYNHFNKMYFQNTYNDSIKKQKQNEGSAYLQVLFQKFIDL
jgi:phosphoglycerol transferase MdoB-like AlkP superfamily enzyme